MKHQDVLIIGAGMTGLSAAKTFLELGLRPLVLDKGRGFGGRMATRRLANTASQKENSSGNSTENSFDHGAQYIQPSPRFLRWLDQNLLIPSSSSTSLLQSWNFSTSKKVFISKHGMSSLAKELASDIEISLNIKITSLERKEDAWLLKDDKNQTYMSKKVLITAPLPQTLELLEKSNIIIDDTDLSAIAYRPCLVVMMNLGRIHNLPDSGAMFIKNPILEWICDNKKKGLPNVTSSVTIHCTEDFSKDKYDLSDEKIFDLVYAEFEKYFPNELASYEIKKWKYSAPLKCYKSIYYRSQFPGLYLAGDAFGGNSLEGAFRSGTCAAYVMKDDVLV